jgi:hypothetical protein
VAPDVIKHLPPVQQPVFPAPVAVQVVEWIGRHGFVVVVVFFVVVVVGFFVVVVVGFFVVVVVGFFVVVVFGFLVVVVTPSMMESWVEIVSSCVSSCLTRVVREDFSAALHFIDVGAEVI